MWSRTMEALKQVVTLYTTHWSKKAEVGTHVYEMQALNECLQFELELQG